MRNEFAKTLVNLAEYDTRIILLAADIGNRLFVPFQERFSDRFFNCGIAEANAVSVAAALAKDGFRPFVYTIAPFITLRCLEQIRVDVCYQNVPVCIVGLGAGLSYASNGPTHHCLEDIAVCRVLPNMNIICPADSFELRAAMSEIIAYNKPIYLRLGKKNEPLVHEKVPDLKIGRSINVLQGENVCILACGNIVHLAKDAALELRNRGIDARLESFHSIKPLDKELLSTVLTNYSLVFTIEEHSIIGGLGSAILEFASELQNVKAKIIRIGTSDEFLDCASSQAYARTHFGLDKDGLVRQIIQRSAYERI